MVRLIASATIFPSKAMIAPKGYSPLLTAMRDNSMQRAIIVSSVISHEGVISAGAPFLRYRCILMLRWHIRRPVRVCAVTRRRSSAGASPTRQPLQPEATGAVMGYLLTVP